MDAMDMRRNIRVGAGRLSTKAGILVSTNIAVTTAICQQAANASKY